MVKVKDKPEGATHVSLNPSGEFIELFYRQIEDKMNDGTTQMRWQYLSSFDIWQYSMAEALGKPMPELHKIEDDGH